MNIHDLKFSPQARKRKRIVGRGKGSGRGKTAGRGENGQRSRSGRWVVGGSEGGQMPLIRRLPKVGFRSHRPVIYQVVNLDGLNKFEKGSVVHAEALKEKGLIKSINKPFKVLGDGEIKKELIVQTNNISKTAKEKVIQAGGKVESVIKTSADDDSSSSKE